MLRVYLLINCILQNHIDEYCKTDNLNEHVNATLRYETKI